MSVFIGFVRGVGGGIRSLPMAAFRDRMIDAGFTNVRTYIASGNVVFEAPARSKPATLGTRLSALIAEHFGFDAFVAVLTPSQLERAAARNPYPQADAAPTTVHVAFLAEAPSAPKLDVIEKLRKPSESLLIDGDVLYLHTPDGMGDSKLGAALDRVIGVPLTARNWRTVRKMMELSRES
jgi:uncharacterized protein (DUF1697 family)